MSKVSRRKGFTLPEVLVTVTIVAVLAAVMVPAVINQVAKGDIPAVGEDFGAIRTGITTFAADVRHYPRRLTDMTVTVLPGDSTDINAIKYAADTANYHGPYLPTAAGAHTGPTGGVFRDTIQLSSNFLCIQDDTTTTGTGDVSKVSLAVATQIDQALDAGNGSATGVVKWTTASGKVSPGTLRVCLITK